MAGTSACYIKKDKKDVFDTVIVVTDRVNLDKQIRDTIKQFMQVSSTVGWAKDASTLSILMEQGKRLLLRLYISFSLFLMRYQQITKIRNLLS